MIQGSSTTVRRPAGPPPMDLPAVHSADPSPSAPRPIPPAEIERAMSRIVLVDEPPPPISLANLPGLASLAKTNTTRLAQSGAYAAAVTGSCFATTFALAAKLRSASSSPWVKAGASLMPVLGGALTVPTEAALTEATGYRPTAPREGSVLVDACVPMSLLAGQALSQRFGLPARMAYSAAVSVTGGFAGGVAAECAAQQSRLGCEDRGAPAAPRSADAALGRAASLAPYAAYMSHKALKPDPAVPARASLVPTAIATGGWVFRNVLTPDAAASAPKAEQ